MTDYDKDLINREVLGVCDHYLTHRRAEGKRQTYLCPECGDRRFEVESNMGYAGCFDPVCNAPTTTDALGLIAYFEEKELSGKGFVECLKKGYEILGVPDPEEGPAKTSGESRRGAPSAPREKAMTPGPETARKRAMTAKKPDTGDSPSEESDTAPPPTGTRWSAAASEPAGGGPTALEQPIQAWHEQLDGSRVPIAAVVVQEHDVEAAPDEEGIKEAEIATAEEATAEPDERQQAHAVYEALLRHCPLEQRDGEFFDVRGLDLSTVQDGRFGSISASRCNYLLPRLEKRFPDEVLLKVPGFYRAGTGQLRCSLYGDYALIPYYDRDGYIRTVEGRFTGEEMGEHDKKYKALINSGVHLYVHPRFKPDEVVAFCEGAVGAMVAARYGFAVASIKGFRNYRQPPADRDGNFSVLPELEGVDFAGREVVYIPDVDVKPKAYEAVMKSVPEACEWLIERQGGSPKVAMLPEGTKDLDAWLLSLDEAERVGGFRELLAGAYSLEEWKEAHLDSGRQEVFEDEAPEAEKAASGDGGGSAPRPREEETPEEDRESGESSKPVPERQQYGMEYEDHSGAGQSNGESPENAPGPDGGESSTSEDEQETPFGDEPDEDTREMAPIVPPAHAESSTEPAVGPRGAPTEGEGMLAAVVFVAAAILMGLLIHLASTKYLGPPGLLLAQEAGLGAGMAIWIAVGFRRLRRYRKTQRLLRHVQGKDV